MWWGFRYPAFCFTIQNAIIMDILTVKRLETPNSAEVAQRGMFVKFEYVKDANGVIYPVKSKFFEHDDITDYDIKEGSKVAKTWVD